MSQSATEFWPPVPDFNPMLQNPNVGFRDAELKECVIERDINNQPRPRAGNFAVCYKASLAATGKNVCIRLFARKSDERRERYAQISEHLKANPIDCLVKFEYIDKGIRHPNPAKYGNQSWFPVIRMDWIEGSILYNWLRDRCSQNDTKAISKAAEQWIEVAQQLESAGIAHCDLQHANVMVTPTGDLKLVDYDCMCVPALVGRPNLELGVEPYQHPERTEETKLFPGMDHFSELFILVVLKALAADPTLWFRHIEPPNSEPYDKLLIRKSDFDAPASSVVFNELKRSTDPEVSRLAKELFKLVQGPMNAVPPLSSFAFNFDDVRSLFRRREWDGGLELLDRGSLKNVPKDLEADSAHARQCVKVRLDLEQALQAGDEVRIQAAYKPQLLDDYPKAQPSVQAAKLSPKAQSILGRLETARNGHQWRTLVEIWDSEQGFLSARKSARRYRAEVDSWRERNQLCDKLQRLRAESPINPESLGDACRAIVAKGGHPEIDAEISQILRLVERHIAVEKCLQLSNGFSEQSDTELLAAWDESLFAGWTNADQARPRMLIAKERLAKVAELGKAIRHADSSRNLSNEKVIQKLAGNIPAGYELDAKIQSRLESNDTCLTAFAKLEQALAAKPHSERVLAECWKILSGLNPPVLVPAQVGARLDLATRRVPLLDKLAVVKLRGPTDVVDTAITAAWNDQLLMDCPDAFQWKQRAADAITRAGLIAELNNALAANDDNAVVNLLDEPLLHGYPFGAALSARIGVARRKNENVRAMLDALRLNRDGDFGRSFDHRVVKDNVPLFVQYQTQIEEVIGREILPVEKLGLCKPLVGHSISSDSSNSNRYRIKWTWPAQRFTDQCLLGVCRGTPNGQVNPTDVAIHRIPIDRQRWETGGGVYSLTAKADWSLKRADILAVWAVIDLGFSTMYSEPLILGRVTHHEHDTRNE